MTVPHRPQAAISGAGELSLSAKRGCSTEQLAFGEWADFFLENHSRPPIRAAKTHEANVTALVHLRPVFGSQPLAEISADQVEQYLRLRLRQHKHVKTRAGSIDLGLVKATTVHQEFRVFKRVLNVAVRKKLLVTNPCGAVEFPVAVRGLFRPHYVNWSERQRIEFHAPVYLRNVVRIITETGLRIYKELASMRTEQVDLANAVVWIPDSKTPNGIAEVPLTDMALQAFRKQLLISGPGPFYIKRKLEIENAGTAEKSRAEQTPCH